MLLSRRPGPVRLAVLLAAVFVVVGCAVLIMTRAHVSLSLMGGGEQNSSPGTEVGEVALQWRRHSFPTAPSKTNEETSRSNVQGQAIAYYSGPLLKTTLDSMVSNAHLRPSWSFLQDFGGWPACEWTMLCISASFGLVLPISEKLPLKSPSHLSKMHPMAQYFCKPDVVRPSTTVDYRPHVQTINISDTKIENTIVLLPGTTLLVDTYIPNHYKHEVGVAMQTVGLLESLAARQQSVDRAFWLRQREPVWEPPMNARKEFLKKITTGYQTRNFTVLGYPDLHKWGLVCMERVVQVAGLNEKLFRDDSHLQRWMEMRKKWNPSGGPGLGNCPQDKVVVLLRGDGNYDRTIVNFSEMIQTLRSLGVCDYSNVTFTAKASLRFQADLFESYGLLLSAHSSQLTNVVFSHPLSATLEIMRIEKYSNDPSTALLERGEGREYATPFCVADLCPTLYNVTWSHWPSSESERRGLIRLNLPRFKSDLASLLQRQRDALKSAGCVLPTYLRGGSCV